MFGKAYQRNGFGRARSNTCFLHSALRPRCPYRGGFLRCDAIKCNFAVDYSGLFAQASIQAFASSSGSRLLHTVARSDLPTS